MSKKLLFLGVFLFLSLAFSCVSFAQGPVVGSAAEEATESLLFMEVPTVVTSTLTARKMTDAPSAMVVVTADDIKRHGYTKLTDVLIDVPGFFDMTDANEDIVGIRGGYASSFNYAMVMVNGHRMNVSPIGNFNPDQYIGLGTVERIEIIKGPGSAIYGTGALLGVINIITKKEFTGNYFTARTGSFTNEFGYSLGRKGEEDSNFFMDFDYLNAPGAEVDVPASLDLVNTGSGRTRQAGKVYLNKYPSNWQAFGGYTSKNVEFDIQQSHLVRITPRGANGNLYDYDTEAFKPRFISDVFHMDLRYKIELSDTSKVTINPSYHFFEQRGGHYLTWGSYDAPTYGTRSSWIADVQQLQARVIYDNQIMDNLSLVSGLDYSNVDFQEMDTLSNNSTYSGFTYTVEGAGKEGNWTVMGLFGQVIYSPIEKLDLILGARYDDFEDKADSEIAPRAGIVFRPMTPLTCKLLYGRAILSPQWTHLTASSVSGSYVGNPNLGPQTVNSKDLIFDLTFDRSVTNLSLFQTKTEDVINSVIVNASTGLRQYQNTGIGDYEGFELSEKIKVLDWMSLNGSVANVAEAGDTTATYLLGADLRYVPKYVYRLGFTMKPIKHLWVDLGGRMYSEVTTDDSVLGNRDIDSWTTIDMSVGYAISDFDIALYLTNLSDEEYEIGGTVSRPLPRAGFGWSLKAGYKF